MLRYPVVRNVVGACGVGGGGVEMKRQKEADRRAGGIGRIWLVESHAGVGETFDAFVTAKVVIEGTIFLDKDDNVFNVGEFRANRGSGSWGGGRGEGTAATSVKTDSRQFGHSCCGSQLEQITTR